MVVGVGWVVGVGAGGGRVVVGPRKPASLDLMARFAVAAEMDMAVPSARLDVFWLGAAQALWFVLIFIAVPPWLRWSLIRSRAPSACHGNGRLATTRR